MSCNTKDWFQVGSTGVDIQLTLEDPTSPIGRLDLTGALSRTIRFRLGTAAAIDKAASVVGDPTLGVIRYITISGDFVTPGTWKAQGVVTLADGSIAKSSVKTFTVLPSL